MNAVKIAVIGAGSAYLPGVIRGVLHRAGDLAGSELACYDPDHRHRDLMATLARRMFAARGAAIEVTVADELPEALTDASFVFTTFRPGGLAARRLDERIPLAHGVIGQETTGPGGFLMACRSVPAMLEIAHTVERVAPDAWIVNYTNPTNIVTGAVTRYSSARIIGLCDQFAADQARWAALLDLPPGDLEVDWAGLNHATWGVAVRVAGTDVTARLGRRLATLTADTGDTDVDRLVALAAAQELLPNSYLRYYYGYDAILAELTAAPTTRAEDIMAMLPDYYAGIAAQAERDDPDPSRARGGGDHGEFAVDTICAIAGDERRRLIVNTVNRGAIASFEPGTIVEVPCMVGAHGPVPLVIGELPRRVRGLLGAIAEYEWLAVHAAAQGDVGVAYQAILAHPFVRDLSTADRILDEGLAAHRAHLPQFD